MKTEVCATCYGEIFMTDAQHFQLSVTKADFCCLAGHKNQIADKEEFQPPIGHRLQKCPTCKKQVINLRQHVWRIHERRGKRPQ